MVVNFCIGYCVLKVYEKCLNGCQTCVNTTNKTEKRNVIASNLIRMSNVKRIVADIHFLAAIPELWFNKEFKWYHGKYLNIGCHGYLSLHRTIGTYVQLRDLDRIQNTWEKTVTFAAYICSYNVLSSDTKKRKACNGTVF